MNTSLKSLAATLFAFANLLVVGHAQTLDMVVFGNTTSEGSHQLATYFPPATDITKVAWQNTPAPSDPSATGPSDVVVGAQGLSARRMLPRTPNGDVYGGQMDFVMTVDPVKQNYFTVKMYASDPNGNNFTILNCNGKEVGGRHGGGGIAEDSLFFGASKDWWKNRFFYRTEPLPLYMTRGKTSVTLTIRVAGPLYTYAPIFTYVPQYQSLMSAPSLGFYSGYTHVGALLDVTGEPQGTAPAVVTPRNLEDETASLNAVKSGVNNQLANDLALAPASLGQNDANFLACSYDARTNAGASWITYPSGQSDATLGTQVVAILDNIITGYAAGNGVEGSDWGGGLGVMGDTVRLTWPLISGTMSATVSYGGTLGTTTRQAAWAKALRASVDAGRYGRQNIANQSMFNGTNIYRANRALLLVDSTKALSESEAIRYLKEACGILPWLGNDQATGGSDGTGGGPTPTRGIAPYGPNWYMCTTKGTTKDGEGFVGGDYGEVGPWMYRMGLVSGDAQLQARGITMTRARLPFRYPAQDESGFLAMFSPDPIGERNNDLPGHYDYLGSANSDDFLMASQGASAIGNDLLGAFQQQATDGQLFRHFYYQDAYLPSRWATIKALAATNVPLPMTAGQPDFAWADEENMVVAAKHGEERFFVNLFWRQPAFINGLAKAFVLTPSYARLGDVMVDDVRFRATGQSVVTGLQVDSFATPEDNPQEAYGALPEAVAYRSDLSAVPASNRDAGRGTGYTFRYGNWLVGINADYSATYPVKLPSNFTSATDLISGQVKSGPVVLAPKTSVVFYLPDVADTAPLPSRSLYLNAVGSSGAVTLNWADAGSANTYNLLRSTTSGSGYTAVASGLTGTKYTDGAVTNGTTYYYVVTATNPIGTSGYSPEASASPVAPETSGLPAPWTNVDEGVSTGGSATLSAGTFTVKSGPGNFGGTTEGFQLVYQPVTGDGVFTARVQSQTAANSGARAGIVVRSNLAQNATMASMTLRASNNADFNFCGSDGGSITGQSYNGTITAPYWVRLVRSGATVTGFISADGSAWTPVGGYTFSTLSYGYYVGLLVNSGSNTAGQTDTAVFTNVNFPLGATAAPAAPTGLAKVAASATGASLGWAETSGATAYNVKRGTSASGPFTTVATGVVATNYTDFGLTSGATYYYVVSAVNAAGESANSAAVTVALLPPPATLAGLSVSASGTQAVLSWSASPGATGYTISRSTSYAGPYTVVASGVTGTGYTDTGLNASTLYYYKVTPTNGSGTGVGATVSSLGTGVPAPWRTLDIGANIPGGASAANGVFTLYGNGNGGHGTPFRYVYQTLTGDGAVTVRLTSLTNTASARAGIMIRDSLDLDSRYVYLDLHATPSGNSVNLEYRQTKGAALNWGDDYNSTQPIWLRAVRFGATTALYTSADGVAWTQYGILNFSLNATVCVGMATLSGDGGTIATAAFDNVAVTASVVSGGTATASADNASNGQGAAQAFDAQINTKWYDYLYPTGWLQYQFAAGVSQVVSQYQLISAEDVPQRDPASWQFQGSNDGATWTTLDTQTGQVFTNRNQANVYNVTNTTAYSYYRLNVTANNGGSGNGIQLSELTLYAANPGTALVPPATPLDLSATWSSGQIALNWQSTFLATSYNMKRGTVSGGPYATVASGLTSPGYTDTSVTNGTPYYYVVSAVNAGGESPNSVENSATAYAVPAVPTGLTAAFGNKQVTLSWNAVSGASQYWIGRATISGGPYTDLGIVSATGYVDAGLANGTTYYYVVAALNKGQLSANSSEVSAIPLPADAPYNFAATAGNTVATLTWSAPSGATGYTVKRATTSGGPYTTVITNTPGVSYVDTGLTNGTTYYYLISPLFGGSTGTNSVQIAATPTSATALLTRSSGGTGTGTTVSGDNSQENPAQVFDRNTSTKWYTTATPTSSQPAWVQYQFGNNLAWRVTQYQITSANDTPQRDPAGWQLLASNDGAAWTTLDTQTGQTFSGRYTANTYAVTNTTPYRYYRLSVTANAGGSSYGLQISEFTLFSSPSDVGDKTAPVVTTPGNLTTTATSAGGAYVSFSTSANDAVSGTRPATASPASGSQFPIGTTTVACSAVDLAGNTGTASFTVTVNGTPAVASASAGTSGQQAAQGFDNSASTKWYNGVTGGTGYLQYQFANFATKTVVGYAITSANDVSQRDPAAWQFQGSPDGSTWTTLDTRTSQSFGARAQTNVYTFTNTTAYGYYRLNVTANSGGSSYGVQLAELTFFYTLPSPWTTVDIGSVGATGAAGADSGVYTLAAAGTDITGTSDALRYTYQSATGDCDITARVSGFVNSATGTKTGVMIRESLNANSLHAAAVLTPGSGVAVSYRAATGGSTTTSSTTGLTAPYWVRIVRSGNTFTFYRSADGTTWTTVTSATVTMATNVYIGLVSTSGTAGTLSITNVDNVVANP